MKAFYKKLIELLTSADAKNKFISKGLKPIILVDDYEGQYFIQEQIELLTPPAVLFEYDIDFINNPGKALISLHCCYEEPRRGNNQSPNLDADLKRFDFTTIVYDLVKFIETETTGKLKLLAEAPVKEPALVKVQVLAFECSYTGKSTVFKQNPTEPDSITLETIGNLSYDFDVSE